MCKKYYQVTDKKQKQNKKQLVLRFEKIDVFPISD